MVEEVPSEPMAIEEKELEPLSDPNPLSEPEAEPSVPNPFAPNNPLNPNPNPKDEVQSELVSEQEPESNASTSSFFSSIPVSLTLNPHLRSQRGEGRGRFECPCNPFYP